MYDRGALMIEQDFGVSKVQLSRDFVAEESL